MKTNNIIKGILAVSVLLIGLASCERADYPDRYRVTKGKPTIDYIRYANKDILLDKAYMDETVCVVGQNLTSVVKLLFNDQAAILNTSFITDKTMLVTIPKTKATVQTNMIYFITAAADTVSYGFEVMPPAPVASGMDCEYAKPGQRAKIFGDYFIDLEYVEFQGLNARVEAEDITYTESELELTIPTTATSGMVKVKTKSGLSGSMFHYMDQRGLLFDFDGKTGLYGDESHGWHQQVVTSDETSISGNFLQLGDGATELKGDGSTWADGNFSFEYWPGMWESPVETFSNPKGLKLSALVDFTDYANMGYKFEMFVPEDHPWKGTAMQILPASIYTVHNGANEGVTDEDGEALYARPSHGRDPQGLREGKQAPPLQPKRFDRRRLDVDPREAQRDRRRVQGAQRSAPEQRQRHAEGEPRCAREQPHRPLLELRDRRYVVGARS